MKLAPLRKARLLAVPLLAFLAASVLCCDAATAAERPNVVLIMADDLGYEALRSYGGKSYDSDLLDRLARQGMRFTHCYSQPVCTPSRNKIMTGRSNARNYVSFGILKPEEITFGHVMRAAGYRTCVAGKWQLTGRGLDPEPGMGTTPQQAGFEESCMWAYVHDLPPGVEHTGGWERPRKPSRYWHPSIVENGAYRPTGPDDYGPDLFTNFCLDFIEAHRDEPFFVYYPMALTHDPFLPTPHSDDLATADRTKSDPRYFGDMVAYTGYCVQRILTHLDELGIAEETLVLFTCDNGTHHSIVSQHATGLFPGGKGLPIDAGCHVPLFAVWKGKIEPGATSTCLVDFSDFLPTIAAATGAELPTDRVLDGQSFLPQLSGTADCGRQAVVVHYDKDPGDKKPHFRRMRFALDGKWKLYDDGRLYDVVDDVNELRPLNPADVDGQATEALPKLREALATLPAWAPDNSVFGDRADEPTRRRRRLIRGLQ